MSTVILLSLVLLRSFIEGQSHLFTYEKLADDNNKPPLYVEEMDTINFYTNSWKIVAGIDMTAYNNELKHLDSAVSNIMDFCNLLSINVSTSCKETATELKNSIDEMEMNTMQVTSGSTKSEDNISEMYLQKFNEIKKTLQVNNKIMDDDALYIEVTRDLILDNTNELQKQKEYIDTRLQKCKAILKEIAPDDIIKTRELKDVIEDIISYATIIVFNFQFEQKAFIAMLRSETILSGETLLEEMKELLHLIGPKKLKLPIDIATEPISKFYDITTSSSLLINKRFIVTYKLPLVDLSSFTLYHLNTCPRKIYQEIFQLMLPDYEYVAISKDKKKYITLNDGDLKKCLHENSLICPLNSPIIYTENSQSCSVHFITNSEISTCNYIIANISSELWIRLEGNSWLFVFSKPTQITVQCNGEVDSRYMNGQGILTIEPTCSAKTASLHIIPSTDRINKIYKRMALSSATKIDWKSIVDKITKTNNIVNYFIPTVMDHKDLDMFEKIKIAVNYIKPLVNQTLKERTWYELNEIEIANYTTFIILIFVMVFKTINCIRRSANNDAEDIDFV